MATKKPARNRPDPGSDLKLTQAPTPVLKAPSGGQSTPTRKIPASLPSKKRRRSSRNKNWLWLTGLGAIIVAALASYFWLSQSASNNSQPQPVSNVGTSDYHSMAFSPADPNTVYFGSHNGLLKSQDGGRNWQTTLVKGQDAMGLGIGKDGKIIYLGGHGVLMKSEDGGQTWRSIVEKLPGTDVHGLASDPANSDSLYVMVVGSGLLKSSDGGQTWQKIPGQVNQSIMSIAYGNQTLWASSMDRGLLRSRDGGQTWESANGSGAGALGGMVSAVALDPTGKNVYAGTSDGLFRSQDGGTSWNKLGYSDGVATLAVNPANPQSLLLVRPGGEVYRSQDGGLTWPGK